MVLKYISLFSGIGGFEVAIHRLYPRAVCVGFSEIDMKAISVYKRNFPSHDNLGDIQKVTRKNVLDAVSKAGGCDLLVAGFPCNDLSSVNTQGKGLDGSQSGLFYELIRIMKILLSVNSKLNIVVENNTSMSRAWKDKITSELSSIFDNLFVCTINAGDMVVQTRRRLFWTTKIVPQYIGRSLQSWDDILEKNVPKSLYHCDNVIEYRNKIVTSEKPNYVKVASAGGDCYKLVHYKNTNGAASRWTTYAHHFDTSKPNSVPVMARPFPLFDKRGCPANRFKVRMMTVTELARLFTFDDNHVPEDTSVNAAYGLFGKAVVVKVVEHVLKHVMRK